MYGVPADLDLGFLHGAELIQVCLGRYQLQFHFHPIGSISVEGEWELRDSADAMIDRRHDKPNEQPCHLPRLLGQQIVRFEVSAPDWFALQFARGEVLRVFDDSSNYESF